MDSQHPVLTNILSLANLTTWQHTLDMGDQCISSWSSAQDVARIHHVYLVGCGTSYYAAQVGEHIVEQIAHVPAQAVQGFAFATYVEPAILGPNTLVAGISASGESEAVCDALTRATQAGAKTLAITADGTSSVARVADAVILTGAEDDRILVRTKSYVQSLVSVYLLALALVEASGSTGLSAQWRSQIRLAAEGTKRLLDQCLPQIEELAHTYARVNAFFVLGTGPNAGTAQEASLKIIEMAKMFSEAQELEDFLHGRLRGVDQATPIFLIAPEGRASRRVLDLLTITHRIAIPSIVLTDRVTRGIERLATHVIHIPQELDELATPLVYIIPLHLFAYHIAIQRGWEPLSRRYEGIVPQKVRYEEEA